VALPGPGAAETIPSPTGPDDVGRVAGAAGPA
jgi:hypothetical protein